MTIDKITSCRCRLQAEQAGAAAGDRVTEALAQSEALQARVAELTAELQAARAQVAAAAALRPAAAPPADEVRLFTQYLQQCPGYLT